MNKNQNHHHECYCQPPIERYVYTHNEPKNQKVVVLSPYGVVESYGYSYANYKPSNNISYEEEQKDDQNWPGVM